MTTKPLTKAQALAALAASTCDVPAEVLATMPVAALRSLVPLYPAKDAGPDLRAEITKAMPAMTAEILAAMPDDAVADLHARVCGTSDTGKGTKGKGADLPKEPKVTLPKVRMALDTDAPRVTRVLDAMRHLKVGTFNLPKLVGTDRNGQPKTGTWQPNTVFNVVLENLVDVGIPDADAKAWAELASTGKVDAVKLTESFKLPTHADRKGKVRA